MHNLIQDGVILMVHIYFLNNDYTNLILNDLMLVWGGFKRKQLANGQKEQINSTIKTAVTCPILW